jgi:RecA/RadA recombinase
MMKILTGCRCLDANLDGGISSDSLLLIYGEPETGKTTLAMQCAVNCALQNYKTLFVDCDNSFAPQRLSQVSEGKFEEIANNIILVKPNDFKEQTAVIDRLNEYTVNNFGLVVVDTVSSLYRVKVAETSGRAFGLNRELNRQMAILAQTAKTQKIPIIVTSQVRSVFDDSYVSIAPVATRVLKFWADTIISMKPTENPQIIRAFLERAQKQSADNFCDLIIGENGLRDYPFHH